MNNDLISRSALLESMAKVVFRNVPVEHQLYVQAACEALKAVANTAPTVDAEPVRHGRWEPVFRRNVFGEHYVEWHACSICKELALSRCENYMDDEELSNYCPNCGCKMDAEVEE